MKENEMKIKHRKKRKVNRNNVLAGMKRMLKRRV